MDFFPLNLFPAGGLSSSVITTVWIGVMVVVFLNLRFGTTLSGLVVPGYLIPLFLVKPTSAWIIILESIITYLIARLIAERAMIKMGLSEFFGRDRFFILILISVLVRVAFDGFLLPMAAEQLTEIGVGYEVRSSLNSFGLIIIALCANQFWNSGFKHGSFTLAIYLAATFVIVRFLLMPYTNFNISTLSYLYEDIASNILASPKAYIILITAAFVASRMNLRYGWDFNGILIPSLLALQWYDPIKIVTTFIEAFVILFLARIVLKISIIKNMNIEGARELFLFFNIGFFYKIILGYLIISWSPETKITDMYGFGYLLGTLIAIKMHQKGIAVRLTRTTIETSLAAVIIASIIGFGLTLTTANKFSLDQVGAATVAPTSQSISIRNFIEKTRKESYRSESFNEAYPVAPFDRQIFTKLFNSLSDITEENLQQSLPQLTAQAKTLGFIISWIDNRYIVMYDSLPERGWGIYLIDTLSTSHLTIQVPRALDETAASDVAFTLFEQLGAKYLAYSGSRFNRSIDGTDNVIANYQTLFQTFHQTLAGTNVIQLRNYTNASLRQILGQRKSDKQSLLQDTDIEPSLWVKRSLPENFSLLKLKQLLGDFELNWREPPTDNLQRETSSRGFAELYLTQRSMYKIFAQASVSQPLAPKSITTQEKINLASFLIAQQESLARKGENSYQAAEKFELLYFQQSILKPILSLTEGPAETLTDAQISRLSSAAAQFGYTVKIISDDSNPNSTNSATYLLLAEQSVISANAVKPRHWGTYIFRVGLCDPYIVEVPMPASERNTINFGLEFFNKLNARALLISGVHPLTNLDGSSKITASANLDSLFNLVHQSLQTHFSAQAPHVIQVRGLKNEPAINQNELTILHLELQKPIKQRSLSQMKLENLLLSANFKLNSSNELNNHTIKTVRMNAQSRFSRYILDAQYSEIWVPFAMRESIGRRGSDGFINQHSQVLKISSITTNANKWLNKQEFSNISPALNSKLQHQINNYLKSENIVQLQAIVDNQGLERLIFLHDIASQQNFLIVRNSTNKIQFIANLTSMNNISANFPQPSTNENQPTSFPLDARWILNEAIL